MPIDRRGFLVTSVAGAAALTLGARPGWAAAAGPVTKPIPSTGEAMPVVGLGTWIVFNVGDDPRLRAECTAVVEAFFASGGRMIDSSPMYGSAQPTIGHALATLGFPQPLFSAEKVWTSSSDGRPQMEQTRAYWKVPRLDLMQIHNLVAWEEHLPTLRAMKEKGEIRYLGITTSHGRRHSDLGDIMAREPLDFVQLTYNILDREVENRLLPLAADRGIAVIANRPYRTGDLIAQFAGKPLPPWLEETGARSWPQFLLRYVISHPAVTCAIPATAKVAHVRENLEAAAGPLPDAAMRQRMADYVRDL